MADSSLASNANPARVFITADAVGGVWQYTMDLATELCASGIHVLVATMGPRPGSQQRHEISGIENLRIVESDFALEWMDTPWRDVDAAGDWLLRASADFEPDVIHLNGYAHAALPWRRPVLVAAHSCVYSWWRAVHVCSPDAAWHEYKSRVARGVDAATGIVAPSRFMARCLENEYALPVGSVQVLYNWTKVQPSYEPKESFCLAAGRVWDPAKNFSLLSGIAPRLSCEVRIAGNLTGPDGHPAALPNVTSLGFLPQPELQKQLRSAGIFVHPALYEPFGLTVLEAARAGCCLALSDIPSLREIWDGTAVFVEPRDPDAWVRELKALMADPARCTALGDAARQRSHAFSAETAVENYLNVYRSLMARGSRPSSEAA